MNATPGGRRRARGHDLRLAGPAAGAWLTAAVLLGAGSATACAVAATSLAGAAVLLAGRVPLAHIRARGRTPRRQAIPEADQAVRQAVPRGVRQAVRQAVPRGVRQAAPQGVRPAVGSAVRRKEQHEWRTAAVAMLICVAASAAGVALRLTAVGSGPVRGLAVRKATASLGGVVTGDPRVLVKAGALRHRETVLVPVRVEAVDRWRVRVPVLVLAGDPAWKRVLPSGRLRFTARLGRPRRGQLLAAVALVRGPPVLIGSPSLPQRSADTIRARLRAAASGLPRDERGVLPGLVDGDTSLLEPELADAFEKAGLTHLMAVSGENLSLIVGAVLTVGRFAGLGRRAGPLLAGTAIFGFLIVARPSPSVLRATAMGAVALAAVVSGRERRGVPALSAAVLVLTLIDPELARSYGFALSVLATAGILVLTPICRRPISRRLPRWLAEPLAVAAGAQLACAPPRHARRWGEPHSRARQPARRPCGRAGHTARGARGGDRPGVLARRPHHRVTGRRRGRLDHRCRALLRPCSVRGHRLAGGACGSGDARHRARRRRRRPAPPAAQEDRGRRARGSRSGRGRHPDPLPAWPPRGWLFVACDVGQGDGLALFAGPGRAVVIDAGPEPRPIDRCLHDLGIGVVPLLVLTHPHADHIDGLPGVLRGRAVGTTVISPESEGEERRFLPGRDIRAAGPGDVWTVGPLTLGVLGPLGTRRVSTRDPGTTVNNASVVLLARWPGLSALLCGDVEGEAQRELLAAGVADRRRR